MKTLAIVLLFCALSVNIFSQDQTSKFSFGLHFTPHLSDLAQNWSTEYESAAEPFEAQVKVGWTTGVLTRMKVGNRISIETGLNYSNKGSASHNQWDLGDSIRDWVIAEQGKYPENSSGKGNHYFIDIPLTLKYIMYQGQDLSYYIRFGIITNLYAAAEYFYEVNYNDGSQLSSHNHHSHQQLKEEYAARLYNLSTLVAVGMEYYISNRFGILLEPIFDINVLPIYNPDDMLVDLGAERYYNIGIKLGLIIR